MAKFYDASMKKMEQSCLAAWRRELLSNLSGSVLEVGSGTGVNLSFYPNSIESLVLTEPEPNMLAILNNSINEKFSGECRAEAFSADALHFPDNTFDSVVSTLVLCSVDSPEDTLKEIKRVLKPGGKLYFIEHVIATETPHLIKWQKIFQPFWKSMCGNCHLTRDAEQYISQAGFSFDTIKRLMSTGGLPIVSPTIKGIAISE